MISEHKPNYQLGLPVPGLPHLKKCVSNQTDFTATRVPGGPEAGQALAFRRPSVTPAANPTWRTKGLLARQWACSSSLLHHDGTTANIHRRKPRALLVF
jgi:hypothetical protein